jgi:hypothetical protein
MFNCGQLTGDSVKYIPSWVPGAGFQRIGAETAKLGREAIGNPLQYMKAEMVKTIVFFYSSSCSI